MSYEDIHEERGDFRVRIENDQDCESPMEDNDLIEIVTPVLRNWNVRTEGALLQEAFDRFTEYRGGGEVFARYAKIFHGITVYAVYMYEHSGVALSASSFVGRAQHASWDSGQIGFAYVLPGKGWEGMDEEKAISGTIETYGQWMNGETYGYIVERKQYWIKSYADPIVEDEECFDWEDVESCWGFIGYDYAGEEALAALNGFAPKEEAA